MDKINFENLPSTKTPLDADNLNDMQSNIEKSVVAVGSSAPSTGENVWLKKGKNLFNKDILLSNVNISSSGEITADSNSGIHYVTVEAGVTYTIFSNVNRQWVLSTSNAKPYLGQTGLTRTIVSGTSTQITIPAGHTYLYIRHYPSNNENNLTQNVQVEQGLTATSYEPYVEKEILVKNGNGVFEKFYSEDNLNHENYSLGEQKIGTWIDGKPLYRKTVQVTNTSFVAGNNNIPHNIDNLKLCIKVEAVKNSSVIVPYINLTNDNKINTATFVTGVNNTNIILRVANDSWGTSNIWYFTLFYTKTTD